MQYLKKKKNPSGRTDTRTDRRSDYILPQILFGDIKIVVRCNKYGKSKGPEQFGMILGLSDSEKLRKSVRDKTPY